MPTEPKKVKTLEDVMENGQPWWDKYVDYQTHIPDEFFVPLSRVEEMLEEAEEIFRITPV